MCKLHHQLKTKKLWRVDLNADGTETWTSYLGRRHTKKAAWYPLPEPLGPDEEVPEHVDDALPLFADPDPPRSDDPLPDPPALTEEQYVEMGRALDALAVMELTYRQWVDKHWDEARSAGLVA